MSSTYIPTPRFKVGDSVMADGDIGTVTEVWQLRDSDNDMRPTYTVRWPTDEWGDFKEDELTPA